MKKFTKDIIGTTGTFEYGLNITYKYFISRAWWLTPVIPALWEAGAGGSQDQEIKTSLANVVKPHLC